MILGLAIRYVTSYPVDLKLSFLSAGLITQTIFITILFMALEIIFSKRYKIDLSINT